MTRPFSSIQCPSCGTSLLQKGSYVSRISPVARFIAHNRVKIILFMMPIVAPLTLIAFLLFGAASGYIGLAIFFTPIAITYLVERPFKLYRVVNCPKCCYSACKPMGYNMKVASDRLPKDLTFHDFDDQERSHGSLTEKSSMLTFRELEKQP